MRQPSAARWRNTKTPIFLPLPAVTPAGQHVGGSTQTVAKNAQAAYNGLANQHLPDPVDEQRAALCVGWATTLGLNAWHAATQNIIYLSSVLNDAGATGAAARIVALR